MTTKTKMKNYKIVNPDRNYMKESRIVPTSEDDSSENHCKIRNIDEIIHCLCSDNGQIQLIGNIQKKFPMTTTVMDTYEISDIHKGIILALHYDRGMYELIVDVVLGRPSIEQICNVVYRQGVGCDHRVIIYTDDKVESGEYNPSKGRAVVQPFINALNRHYADIHLVKLDSIDPWNSEHYHDEVSMINYSRLNDDIKFPTELALRQTEFCSVYFAQTKNAESLTLNTIDNLLTINDYVYDIIDYEYADINVKWDDIGMYVHIIERTNLPDSRFHDAFGFAMQAIHPNVKNVIVRTSDIYPNELLLVTNLIPIESLLKLNNIQKLSLALELSSIISDIRGIHDYSSKNR